MGDITSNGLVKELLRAAYEMYKTDSGNENVNDYADFWIWLTADNIYRRDFEAYKKWRLQNR